MIYILSSAISFRSELSISKQHIDYKQKWQRCGWTVREWSILQNTSKPVSTMRLRMLRLIKMEPMLPLRRQHTTHFKHIDRFVGVFASFICWSVDGLFSEILPTFSQQYAPVSYGSAMKILNSQESELERCSSGYYFYFCVQWFVTENWFHSNIYVLQIVIHIK